MENIFEKLAEITKPEPIKRYMVKTQNRGILYFDELPQDTYYCGGFQDANDKGKAMLYTWDNGTCLIPIIDTLTGQQVYDLSKAAQ
jgi:hypothetical protein